jgi:hypothetical protein
MNPIGFGIGWIIGTLIVTVITHDDPTISLCVGGLATIAVAVFFPK